MPKTIIFANGVPSNLNAARPLVMPDDTIICADGGALHALSLGLTPDLIVGDLDSLPQTTVAQMQKQGVAIERHPVKKDETDLELALSMAIERGATEILLLTALGGRLDQTLANILLLTRPEFASVRLGLADGNQRAWLLRGPDSLALTGQPGDTLSVVPLSPTIDGLTLAGVEWPLNRTTVSLGSTLTISNSFVQAEAIVRLEAGIALVIRQSA